MPNRNTTHTGNQYSGRSNHLDDTPLSPTQSGGRLPEAKWFGIGLSGGGKNLLPITTDVTIAAGSTLDLGGGTQQVNSLSGYGSLTSSNTGRPLSSQ